MLERPTDTGSEWSHRIKMDKSIENRKCAQISVID